MYKQLSIIAQKFVRSKTGLLILFLSINLLFYGKLLNTWFQQDEWSVFGRYFYLNSTNNTPLVGTIKYFLFPDPRFSFAPLSYTFDSLQTLLFGLNFTPYALTSISIRFLNTILIYTLISRLVKNRNLAILSAFLFASSAVGQKATTWVIVSSNVQLSTMFSLLSFIFLLSYLDKQKLKHLVLSLLIAAMAFLVKEYALVLFFASIVYLLGNIYVKKSKKYWSKKALYYYLAFLLVYVFTRVILSNLATSKEHYVVDLPPLLQISEVLTHLSLSPIRSFIDTALLPNTIYALSRFISPIIWPKYKNIVQTTEFGLFSESTGVNAVHVILIPFLFVGLVYLYKVMRRKPNTKVFYFLSIFIILSSSVFSALLFARGKIGIKHIIRSRDLYISSIGSSTVFAYLLIYFWNKRETIIKTAVIFITLSYILYNYNYLNKYIFRPEVDKARMRIPIVNYIYARYPVIPKRVVFYTESDTAYYGSTKTEMPFQTGFGRTLLVWYVYQNKKLPPDFVKDDYLYLPHSQGYKEIEGYGFGYFTDMNEVSETIEKYQLTINSIIAFSYKGNENKITDISEEVKLKLVN